MRRWLRSCGENGSLLDAFVRATSVTGHPGLDLIRRDRATARLRDSYREAACCSCTTRDASAYVIQIPDAWNTIQRRYPGSEK